MKLSVSHNKQAIKNTWSPSITHTAKLIINANLIAANVCACVCVSYSSPSCLSLPQLCKLRCDRARMSSLHSRDKHHNRHFERRTYYFSVTAALAFFNMTPVCVFFFYRLRLLRKRKTTKKHPHFLFSPKDLNIKSPSPHVETPRAHAQRRYTQQGI